ncbi:hypothetical protein BH11MYX1_BH11MYX1_10520 [soil metagenome]
MDPLVFLLGVPGIAALAYAGWNRSQDAARRTRRVLKKTRVTPFAELSDGLLACVVGTVEVDDPAHLTSMITKRACVAYDTNVYFFVGHTTAVPARVEVERRLVPFFVRDASGVVRIDAAEAALCNPPAANSDRYIERLIEVGAKIRIVGSVHLEPARDHGFRERHYRELTGMKATLTGTARFPLLIDLER